MALHRASTRRMAVGNCAAGKMLGGLEGKPTGDARTTFSILTVGDDVGCVAAAAVACWRA